MSDELRKWRDSRLNSISPSFCAAKWYNASLHLGHGFTNSCHLPLPHPVNLEEIKTNPSALHNTAFKKKQRRMMLEGKRPAECSYCWKVEDIGRDNIADRVYKSRIYKDEDIKILEDTPWDEDVNLKTVEISFDRTCNFACSYCNAGYSTTWGKDIKNNGAYQKFKTNSAGAYYSDGSWADKYGKDGDSNPFVQAFLEWWPELYKDLQEVRVTGGEPSLSYNFWKFVDLMKEYDAPHMTFAVNSNLGCTPEVLKRLINATHDLNIKDFDLYTSNESFGEHAEYIRDGLKYETWRSNLVEFIERSDCRQVVIMMTINSLCLLSIDKFLDDMMVLKDKYGPHKPIVDLNILRWPAFMAPLALPENIKQMLHYRLTSWFDRHRESNLLFDGEKAQIQRLIDYIEVVEKGHVSTEGELEKHFHDFKSFYEQYDHRRGKDFRKTFPELVEWYDSIKVDESLPLVGTTTGEIVHYEGGEYQG